MSETTEADQGAATEPSQTEPPETAATTAPPPGTEQDPKTEGQERDETPKPKLDPRDQAIRSLAVENREIQRQLKATREELDRLHPKDPNAPPDKASIEAAIERRAEELNARKEVQAKTDAWIAKGNADFPDFTERCNALAEMGAGTNATFMAAISKLPDGHKVIAELANDASEANRVLSLSPVDMTLELASISHRIGAAPPVAPKAVSKLEAPIKPISTAARAEGKRPEDMSSTEYQAYWNKRSRG